MKTYHSILKAASWYSAFKYNYSRRNYYNITYPNQSDFIFYSFYWDATPQKRQYWKKINHIWVLLHCCSIKVRI